MECHSSEFSSDASLFSLIATTSDVTELKTRSGMIVMGDGYSRRQNDSKLGVSK